MRIMVAVFAAYLITGIVFVWRDLRQTNPVRIPFYIMKYRREGGVLQLALAALGWFPFTVFACTMPGTGLRHLKKEFGYWLLFVTLTGCGLYFSSI